MHYKSEDLFQKQLFRLKQNLSLSVFALVSVLSVSQIYNNFPFNNKDATEK